MDEKGAALLVAGAVSRSEGDEVEADVKLSAVARTRRLCHGGAPAVVSQDELSKCDRS
jgi:hypothetical protein